MYKFKQKPQIQSLHILDPDYNYHSTSLEERMYSYFKGLHIADDVKFIIGIYIEFNIQNVPFENHPLLYTEINARLENKIEHYFDFGNANLFNENTNFFFITMFNIPAHDIEKAFFKIHQELGFKKIKYKHKEHMFSIRCGVYMSQTYISPHSFLELTLEQYKNTLTHPASFFSLKKFDYSNVFHEDDKSNK